jgi:multidrug efflux pump subunit AcrA (membrane-fusion protein)
MKLLRITLVALMLCSVSAISLSCTSEEDSAATENEVATVQRGDLAIEITAVGNLALSHRENLTFEVSGTVEEVLVEEGDSVEEGQVLVRLDYAEWQDQRTTLEYQIELKKRDLIQAELNLTSAEADLANTENPEMATAQAEQNVANAKIALDMAQTNYDRAKERYESNWTVPEWIMDYELKTAQLTIAELNLAEAEEALTSVFADIEQEVAKKEKELAIVQGKLEDAQDAVEEAQAELEEVQAASTKITAPFGGFITGVYVKEGDEVQKGTVAIELANAEEFEADILVNETDIFDVSLGGEAWVEVDALQGMNFPATVTRISPTATISQGVVNYSVKVELQSLEAIAEEQQAARQEAMEGLAEGEIPEFLQRAIDAGMITEEQANEMLERMRSGDMPFQRGEGEMPFEPGEGGMFFRQGEGEMQLPFSTEGRVIQSALLEDFQLREGLTVTVTIIVDERNDVLLVPNSAIVTSGMRTYVRVMLADGTIEERPVTTGISDWQYTEVTEGLSEGENVVVPTTTSSSTTTTPQQGPVTFFRSGR